MKTEPTYSGEEILVMAPNVDMELFKILAQLIEEEVHLYDQEELITLMHAVMIMNITLLTKIYK